MLEKPTDIVEIRLFRETKEDLCRYFLEKDGKGTSPKKRFGKVVFVVKW